ncbi:GPAT4 acyltransferase, partial [Leiothrix lutea]|nr:GPAT4 acyltransferase [Leiothrix lutea]
MFLLLPFDSLVVNLLGISITVLFTLLLVFIIVPAIFGVSFGIRKVYMKTLLKIFQAAASRLLLQDTFGWTKSRGKAGLCAASPEWSVATTQSSQHASVLDCHLLSRVWTCHLGGQPAALPTLLAQRGQVEFSSLSCCSLACLCRTNYNFQYISLRLTVLWGLGVLIRYCFLLPLRIALAFTGISLLVTGTTVVGYLPNGRCKDFLSKHVHLMCYRICVRALTAIITYHDRENRPRNGGICVANHTSPIDVIILASDGYYAMV